MLLTRVVYKLITRVRFSDQLDTSNSEVNVLKNNITKLSADNNSLIREGEEQLREKEETLKYELK